MERGLLWLPLLAVFIWLAWAGWNEFQKVAAYQQWAQDFERAKYDILAVIGTDGSTLTWGIPTRTGPRDLQLLDLQDVQEIELWVNGKPAADDSPPRAKRCSLRFKLPDRSVEIPFTDLAIAQAWCSYLQGCVGSLPAPRDQAH
ncbi:hypothetical protein C7271_01335 [filamentous cyanobacterium CCP5]|nr:hypothetical protein C7271_01335 [filamentous cyanobacterium CCP5]